MRVEGSTTKMLLLLAVPLRAGRLNGGGIRSGGGGEDAVLVELAGRMATGMVRTPLSAAVKV